MGTIRSGHCGFFLASTEDSDRPALAAEMKISTAALGGEPSQNALDPDVAGTASASRTTGVDHFGHRTGSGMNRGLNGGLKHFKAVTNQQVIPSRSRGIRESATVTGIQLCRTVTHFLTPLHQPARPGIFPNRSTRSNQTAFRPSRPIPRIQPPSVPSNHDFPSPSPRYRGQSLHCRF